MKSLFVVCLILSLASDVFAADLLKCNPPMGSGVQEIKISQVGNKLVLTELTFRGGLSKAVSISALGWLKKDIKYTSPEDGVVHLYQMRSNGQTILSYEANRRGVIGNCR